jgi:isochorismate hydrolase
MASASIRDPLGDHLLTPQNAALLVIDYQPSQFAAVRSMDPDLLLENIISTVKTAKAFGLPIVHSTVNVASGRQQPTVSDLAELLDDYPPIDRTTLNSWEDADFLAAVRATGRRKLILCALSTEICMTFPPSTPFARATTSIPSSMRSAAPAWKPTAPASSGSSKPEPIRSAGSRSRASFSATGHAKKRWPTSSRSCSPSDC